MKKNKQLIIKILTTIEDYVLITCLAVMGIVLLAQVISRYFFNTPLMWTEELSRYLQIWLTFLGIGYGLRHNAHVSMVLVCKRLSKRIQLINKIISNIIMIICFAFFIPAAINFAREQNQILSSAMQLPMSIVYCVGPIGGFVYCIYTVIDTINNLKKFFIADKNVSDINVVEQK